MKYQEFLKQNENRMTKFDEACFVATMRELNEFYDDLEAEEALVIIVGMLNSVTKALTDSFGMYGASGVFTDEFARLIDVCVTSSQCSKQLEQSEEV